MHAHSSTRAADHLSDDDRELLTPAVLDRWARDLHPDDVDPAEIADLERKRRANLKTLRQGAELTDLEFRLVRYLQKHAGKVRTYVQIANHLWGTQARPVTPSQLRYRDGYAAPMVSHIQNLVSQIRKKLEVDPLRPQHLASVRGVGYAFYDAPPSLDDGIDYGERGRRYSTLREQMAGLLGGSLPGGRDPSAAYLELEAVDAVSYDERGERYVRRPEIGPAHKDYGADD
jgi:hypothetical protein